MDKFLVLNTITDQALADATCEALEEAEIPVMLEHVTIQNDDSSASGYRILVPSEFTQTAMSLIERVSLAFSAKLVGGIAANPGYH
ncbi:hypothetical protein OAO01_05955 [Oligoflexia bacterium]|nr:hypothetical protein [Oligoflexia bacterium]